MNKTFAFRQREGHLNWKLISAVDIFRIVDELRIDELQSVLDPVAFCEFSVSDVKRNTVDATTKLVHLMQLMIEYLLYCQESQLQLVKDLDTQNRTLRKDLKACTRENMAFREDIKIYKRQLALLKQALNKGEEYGDNISYRLINPPLSREHLKPILDPICAMVECIQRHEKETRDYMRTNLNGNTKENITPVSNIMGFTWEQMKEALQKQREDLAGGLSAREALLNARQAELEERENQLSAAELLLREREDELERGVNSKSIALNTTTPVKTTNIKKFNVHFVAMNFLHTTLKSSFYKSLNKYFLRWKMTAWQDKIEELSVKYEECRGELYAAGIRETRMKALLASVRQHNILESAKNKVESRQKPTQNEIAINTSLSFEAGQLNGVDHQYRNLTWAELASRNQYLASITSPEDMMKRFERRAEYVGRDIDAPQIDELFRELAEEMVQRVNRNNDVN